MLERLVRANLYYPTRLRADAAPPPWARGATEVRFDGADGTRLHGLHWPASSGRPTILYLHGNAQNVFDWALVREDLAAVDAGLWLIDYPGYGKSDGQPNEAALYAAGLGALDWLVDEAGVAADQVVVLGKSLGGGVATYLGESRSIGGLILESTFRSVPAVIRRLIPVVPTGLLKSERYESIERLPRIEVPLLVVHGTRDQLIAVKEGRALYEAGNEPKRLYLVDGAGHNDVADVAGRAYGETLREWINEISG